MKIRLTDLLYADKFVLCVKLGKDLRDTVGRFPEDCSRRGLKVTGDKSKVMVLNGEEG